MLGMVRCAAALTAEQRGATRLDTEAIAHWDALSVHMNARHARVVSGFTRGSRRATELQHLPMVERMLGKCGPSNGDPADGTLKPIRHPWGGKRAHSTPCAAWAVCRRLPIPPVVLVFALFFIVIGHIDVFGRFRVLGHIGFLGSLGIFRHPDWLDPCQAFRPTKLV